MIARIAEPWHRSPAVRFVVVGGANTAATGALVVLLSLFLAGWLAFTLSFTIGLIFSVLVTGRWVFRSHLTSRRAVAYVSAYGAIYLCGLTLVRVLDFWGAPPAANAATVLLTAPLSFIAGKLIFTNTEARKVNR